MPETKVVFYQDQNGNAPVLEWLKTLLKQNRKGYANCVARIQQLASVGHELRPPAADYLRDGIYELRAKHIRVQYRILYFFSGKDITVLTHAITKDDDQVPSMEIEKAIKRKKQFEIDPVVHTYVEEFRDDNNK